MTARLHASNRLVAPVMQQQQKDGRSTRRSRNRRCSDRRRSRRSRKRRGEMQKKEGRAREKKKRTRRKRKSKKKEGEVIRGEEEKLRGARGEGDGCGNVRGKMKGVAGMLV